MSEILRPSLMRRLRNSWRAWASGRYGTFDLVPDGFVYTRNTSSTGMKWSEIDRIDAGITDFLTTDLLYVVIHAAGQTVTIDETADGFRPLENALFEHWPQIREGWTALYKGPPSQPRCETLWRRSD